jgi:GLPGLI family protein
MNLTPHASRFTSHVSRFMLHFVLLAVVCLWWTSLRAQEKFIFEGKIEYERKINLHRQADFADEDGMDWYKEFLKKSPVFHNSTFVLNFNKSETIYRLSGELQTVEMSWLLGPAKENIVYNNFDMHSRKSVKSVFEKKYVIADSLGETKWRISDEKRTIAGIECRKAVSIICDSVYVVAFYADEIPVSGGPESFGGLPGMILGLAIPRLHTTWFATRVMLSEPSKSDFAISTRGQQTDSKKMRKTLEASLSDWGKYGHRNVWWVVL